MAKKIKNKSHKGMLKRIVIKKNQILMRRVGENKYATKRSNRAKSSRRRTSLFPVPKYYINVLKKKIPKLRFKS